MNNRRAKTSLKNIPLTLFVTFVCEREFETEQRLQYIDPHSYGHQRCVSRSPNAQPEAHSAGFLYCILSPTGLVPKLHRGP